MWDEDGENVLEHLAGVEDFDLAGELAVGFAVLLPALKDCAVSKCLCNVGKASVA